MFTFHLIKITWPVAICFFFCIKKRTQCEPEENHNILFLSTRKLAAIDKKTFLKAGSIKYKCQTNQHQTFKAKTTNQCKALVFFPLFLTTGI